MKIPPNFPSQSEWTNAADAAAAAAGDGDADEDETSVRSATVSS